MIAHPPLVGRSGTVFGFKAEYQASCFASLIQMAPAAPASVADQAMTRVIAFDVNETLFDLRALDAPFVGLLGSAGLRPR